MSIFLFFSGVGAFLGFGMDIFYKEKPKITFNRIIIDEEPAWNMTDRNFLFGIYDQYSDRPIPDFHRRFTVSFDYLITENMMNNNSIFRIPFEKCSDDVLNKWGNFFEYAPRDIYQCFPKGKVWPIKGVDNQGDFQNLRIQLEFCQNNKETKKGAMGSNCIPKEDTLKILQGKRIKMHYIIENSLINTFDYTSPRRKSAYTGYANTDPSTWSRMTISYKQILSDK